MIKTTQELLLELSEYANPNTKIKRLINEHKLYKIKQGLYETDIDVNPYYLSDLIYGPSYISFQTALACYNMIPERVYAITCATANKHKSKTYNTAFGNYIYNDIPSSVYPYDIKRIEENGYCYYFATREKALCDILYEYSPVNSIKELKELLFEDLRIDLEIFNDLNKDKIIELSKLYRTTNHKLLIKLLGGTLNDK